MLTVDEQLEQALTKVRTLEADVVASTDLLSETEIKAQSLASQLTELQIKHRQLEAELQTKERDMEKLASRRLAELLAATGTKIPVPVTPQGDRHSEELIHRFQAITDPKEQTLFWRSLTPQQQTQILATATHSQIH